MAQGCPTSSVQEAVGVLSQVLCSFHRGRPGRVGSTPRPPGLVQVGSRFREPLSSPGCRALPRPTPACPHLPCSLPAALFLLHITHKELFKAGLCACLGHPRGEAHPGRSRRPIPQQRSLPPACRLLFLPTCLQGQGRGTGRAGAFSTRSSIPVVMRWAD